MRNERGFITVDFIFAIVLILGFTAMLFVLTFTLTVASITQYITFAAARNYSVAHLDQATQEAKGQAKYQELMSNKVFQPLFAKKGWFTIDATAYIGDGTKNIPGYAPTGSGSVSDTVVNEFWGVGTHFVAPILDFHIPFFGSSAPDSDGSGAGFKTYIASYLGREPSADECIQFTAARFTAILALPVSGGSAFNSGAANTQAYYPMTDDGC